MKVSTRELLDPLANYQTECLLSFAGDIIDQMLGLSRFCTMKSGGMAVMGLLKATRNGNDRRSVRPL